jgi:hypothetical protein
VQEMGNHGLAQGEATVVARHLVVQQNTKTF